MLKRREFDKATRGQMLLRAKDSNGTIRCEGCGIDLTGKRFEFDHVVAEALIVDKKRPLTADDGQLLGRDCCHRSPGGKTARDVAIIAKAKRVEAKHLGLRNKGPSRLQSRGFQKQPKTLWRSEAELARMSGTSGRRG